MTSADFEPWTGLWRLEPDGAPFVSKFGSRLAPVRFAGAPAMLKIANGEEERRGVAAMAWWAGEGAARVLAWDDPALLLERAEGPRSLAAMARGGEDDEAMRILCRCAARLHAPRASPPRSLVPLAVWFQALAAGASSRGGIFATAWSVARELLASPREERPLHGDLHHDNVLDFGPRGWLAIDPKGLMGERGFDYANMVCNPDVETAAAPGALARRARIVCAEAGFEPERYLRWVLAWAGLSATWSLDSGEDAWRAVAIARIAAGELGLG
ncbi:MAG: aminoglycoside phosphotransferase family protein [Caulobacteraceae bacterium]